MNFILPVCVSYHTDLTQARYTHQFPVPSSQFLIFLLSKHSQSAAAKELARLSNALPLKVQNFSFFLST